MRSISQQSKIQKMKNRQSWFERQITSKTKAYKDFVKEMESKYPEEFYRNGERQLTEKEKKFLKIYNTLDYEKIKDSHRYEISTLFGSKPQCSIMVSTLAEATNQLELLKFSNNHTYIYKDIPNKTEVFINNPAEKEKLLSDLWAKELSEQTDLSKGLTSFPN